MWGAGALPQILQAGKSAGINFVSVDDFVREKYGMSAADVVSRVNSNCPTPTAAGAAVAAAVVEGVAVVAGGTTTGEVAGAVPATLEGLGDPAAGGLGVLATVARGPGRQLSWRPASCMVNVQPHAGSFRGATPCCSALL